MFAFFSILLLIAHYCSQSVSIGEELNANFSHEFWHFQHSRMTAFRQNLNDSHLHFYRIHDENRGGMIKISQKRVCD